MAMFGERRSWTLIGLAVLLIVAIGCSSTSPVDQGATPTDESTDDASESADDLVDRAEQSSDSEQDSVASSSKPVTTRRAVTTKNADRTTTETTTERTSQTTTELPASSSTSTQQQVQTPAAPDAEESTPASAAGKGPIKISDLSVSQELLENETGRTQLKLHMTTDRCVYARVSGATSFYNPERLANECILGHRVVLVDRLFPGEHTITVDVWDENGLSASQVVTFVIPPASTDPCRIADSVPKVWKVKVGTPAELQIAVAGDCGSVSWTLDELAAPDGLTMDAKAVIYANPTGPARGEVISFTARPAKGTLLWARIELSIVTDEEPDNVPCKIQSGLTQVGNNVPVLQVRLGETITNQFQAVGNCGNYRWEHTVLPSGSSFTDGLLTVKGEALGTSSMLSVSLFPEQGNNWASPFVITVVE